MRSPTLRAGFYLLLSLILSVAAPAAGVRPETPRPVAAETVLHGGPADAAKAAGDTTLLMGPHGSGAPAVGTFETAGGAADWNGWTSVDETQGDPVWHVATYNVVSGQYSAWCGSLEYPACDAGDVEGGYGNSYYEALEWRGTVADKLLPCLVTIGATANHDVEVGYDSCHVTVEKAGGDLDLWTVDGKQGGVTIDVNTTYLATDYVGAAGDEVVVLFRVISDYAYSDEDCLHPSAGAMQLDDVVITLSNGSGASHDFEDGTLGPFTARPKPGVGDFAHIWTGLEDIDPCLTNYSPQVAFIDDGVVVPGTGGSYCDTWCYGPDGWVVNSTGGLAGENFHLDNSIVSPPMAWPAGGPDGALLSYGVYEHEDMRFDSPGIFHEWKVRSVATGDPSDLEQAGWRGVNLLVFPGSGYERRSHEVAEYLVPGRSHVQVKLRVFEFGWVWGWDGQDATPAPYFDNVRFEVYDLAGPTISAREGHLAQDGFPAHGILDAVNPGSNSVRFDMATDIGGSSPGIVPGDSVVVKVSVVRQGATLEGNPLMHYRLHRNTLFDPYRTSGLPDLGSVVCDTVMAPTGLPVADAWFADLPDEGFLFPGDVLHYYFAATDVVAGDLRTSILPADTTGFGAFGPGLDGYDRRFTVRALPSLSSYGPDAFRQPEVLLWIHDRTDAGWDRWADILDELCFTSGGEYDVFGTRDPTRVLNQGLGSRATVAQIAGYDVVVCATGDGLNRPLGGGDPANLSPDVQLLADYLDLADRGLLTTGDDLATGLLQSGAGTTFLADDLGLTWQAGDLRPYIGGQTSPRVLKVPGADIFWSVDSWIAEGGCPTPRAFDVVSPMVGTEVLAGFAEPGGAPGSYPYAAASVARNAVSGSGAVHLPYDLAAVATDPNESNTTPGSAGARLLDDVLVEFGVFWYSVGMGKCVSGVPGEDLPPARFSAGVHPNPFNPTTRISWTVARAGRLQVKVFDLRGHLVRTLMDEQVSAAGYVDWDGTDGRGAQVASGVYFYEVRMDNEVEMGKMALIR